jgi:succinate dehydrogenase / fumarate reductase cytochrome b subunit
MSDFKQTFNSSLGKKLIMALTGLFLCTYLIVHLAGNLQLFKNDGGQAFNQYAHFMTHFPPIKVISYLLYLSILVHALYAIILTIGNRKARPVKYASSAKTATLWSSTNMGLLGSILFLFIVIHMGDFWFKYHNDKNMGYKKYTTELATGKTTWKDTVVATDEANFYTSYTDGKTEVLVTKDLNGRVVEAFKNPVYVAFYVLAMVALSFHLLHGFQSGFQTVGVTHRRYKPLIKCIGIWLFAVIIPLGFAAMPIVYYFTR